MSAEVRSLISPKRRRAGFRDKKGMRPYRGRSRRALFPACEIEDDDDVADPIKCKIVCSFHEEDLRESVSLLLQDLDR